MATLPFPILPTIPARSRVEQALLAGMGLLVLVLAVALGRRLASGIALLPPGHAMWLGIHLVAVIPAVPLGGYLLWARKGDRTHRLLGRLWAGMMLVTALSSFGLRGTGHLSWIHLLSIVVLVSVPRGVILAIRGNIPAHRAAMLRVYAGLVIAGFFTFLPGRLLGAWLFG